MAAASLLLAGCAKTVIVPDVTRPTPAPTAGGQIAARAGTPGMVVAAPHGSSDLGTDVVATEIARRTGFGLVVATGFTLEPDARDRPGRRLQVNRPFEGVPGRPASEDVASAAASQAYRAWEARVREAAAGPLALYVEIHGNNRRDTANRVEIATVGVDAETAFRLRTLFELTRDAHLRAHADAPRLGVLVEPADTLSLLATGAKREGILRLPRRALHIELPRAARGEWRELYAAILADFVNEAAALR